MCQKSVNFKLCCIKTYQGRSRTKVPRLDMYRSIISLSKRTHKMWHHHPFIQRSKTSKIAVEVKVGGNGEERFDKILKRWGK